jgi:hypothetical protein
MAASWQPPTLAPHATVRDLLQGTKRGWQEQSGRLVPSPLDPVRLAQHFRKIRACGTALGRPRPEGGNPVDDDLLRVLPLALRERGWLITRKDVWAAWWLASLDPQGPEPEGGGDDPF